MDEQDKNRKKFFKHVEKLKRTSLSIQRIPEKYKTQFMKLSKEEFCNDYGMCLRELLKIYDGFYPKGNEEIEGKLDVLASEVATLKAALVEEKSEKDPPEGYIYSADRSRLIRKGG